jgi:hypothetical protein
MKSIKNLPVYVLSGALIFVGITSASQAQAAWTSKETARIKVLEAKIQKLEKQATNLEDYVYDFADVYDTQAKYEVGEIEKLGERITNVEEKSSPGTLLTLRYLAVGGSGGTFGDICPGAENLDFGGGYASYVGRLTPKTNLFGVAETNASGQPVTQSVYACKIQFYAAKK